MVTRESKGILTTVSCRGFFVFFVQGSGGREKRGKKKVDYGCLNCQDVERRGPENEGIQSF